MKVDLETIGYFVGVKGSPLGQVFLVALALLLVILLACPGWSMAQEERALPFFVDTSTFQALDDSGKSYVELYILLSSRSLEFQEEDDAYRAGLAVAGTILDGDGQEHWSSQWRKDILVSTREGLDRGSSILDIAGLIIAPGLYDLRVDVTDEVSSTTGYVTGQLHVPGFLPDTLSISQVELALEITPWEEEGEFVKNGLRVLPNPSRIYGPKAPVLYFYAEIYGLLLGSGEDSTYTLQQEILTPEGELVKRYDPKTRRKPGATSVEVGGINVLGLEPQTYIYLVKVRDNSTGAEVYSQRWFRVSSPVEAAEVTPVVSAALTPEEAERSENVIKYIASSQEMKTYRSLSLEAKARFLADFWNLRDPDRSTPENEFQDEHLLRWRYANQHFSKFQTDDGWKSDRGRVYILYGPPDDIERHPSDVASAAWERWHYYSLEGGVQFIFADLSGFDNFVLLHSTARNELRDWGWQEKVYHRQ